MNEKINFDSPIPYYIQLMEILRDKIHRETGLLEIKSQGSRICVNSMELAGLLSGRL